MTPGKTGTLGVSIQSAVNVAEATLIQARAQEAKMKAMPLDERVVLLLSESSRGWGPQWRQTWSAQYGLTPSAVWARRELAKVAEAEPAAVARQVAAIKVALPGATPEQGVLHSADLRLYLSEYLPGAEWRRYMELSGGRDAALICGRAAATQPSVD